MPLILCVTVVASVGIGVVAAYAAVIGILSTTRKPPIAAESKIPVAGLGIAWPRDRENWLYTDRRCGRPDI